VEPSTARHQMDHVGKTYYFCCAHCLEKFRAHPEDYLAPRPAPGAGLHMISIAPAPPAKSAPAKSVAVTSAEGAYVCPMCPEVRSPRPGACPRCGMALEPEMPVAATRVEYTCPMHPEIVRAGPGSCPICGMALEPRTVSAQEEDNPELRDMTRRFWISLALTSPLLLIAMSHMLPGMPRLLPESWQPGVAAVRLVVAEEGEDDVGLRVAQPLVIAALGWCLFGTISVMVAGLKLPGLQFRNQRVEAAYRKELVYGEDHTDRAQPATKTQLFTNVRRNYFKLYFHYIYFNVVRYTYLQADNIFSLLILGPSLVAHKITFGALNQISNAFGKVTNSLQFLLNSWSTIVELQSVHKRLRAFEATLQGEQLPVIDQHYLEREQAGMRPEDQPVS